MDTATYGMIEIVGFFGGVMGFALYQLRALRKLREEEARRAESGEEAPRPNRKSREDIFWDTLAKKHR
ncbi:MAG: hypothetical protein AAF677_11795 [Pseudomonadota bacterium]